MEDNSMCIKEIFKLLLVGLYGRIDMQCISETDTVKMSSIKIMMMQTNDVLGLGITESDFS